MLNGALHTVFIITYQSLLVICSIYFPGGRMIATRNGLNMSLHASIFNYFILYIIIVTVCRNADTYNYSYSDYFFYY